MNGIDLLATPTIELTRPANEIDAGVVEALDEDWEAACFVEAGADATLEPP